VQIQITGSEQKSIIDLIVSVLWKIAGDNLRYITLEGLTNITPDNLANDIVPYLQDFQVFGRIHSELTGKGFNGLRVIQIHNEAPKIEIIGMGDFIRSLIELFQFRKRGQEATLRDIDIEERKLAYALKTEEVRSQIAQIRLDSTNQSKVERAKLETIIADAENKKLDLEIKRMEVQKKQATLQVEIINIYIAEAETYVDEHAPNLPKIDRIELVHRLAQHWMSMGTNSVTPRLGWHENRRPDNLPSSTDKSE